MSAEDNLSSQFKRKSINKHDFWWANMGKGNVYTSCCNHRAVNTGRPGDKKWSLQSRRTDNELGTFRSVKDIRAAAHALHDEGNHEYGYEQA